jgi:trans-2,3-dihydro-3-hydroxyanthranilate isomerase
LLSLDAGDLKLDDADSIEGWSCGLPYLCITLRSHDALKRARCNEDIWHRHFENLWAAEPYPFFAEPGGAKYHVRMFAPWFGVAEDPATGSAAAALAGYVGSRSPRASATVGFTVFQGAEIGRPSRIDVEIDATADGVNAVRVAGQSVLVASGTLHVK